MTKQEILDRFKDINEAYNDSSRYDSLSRMLDELLKEQEAQKFFVDESGKITPLPVVVRCKDCKHGRQYEPNAIDCEYRELATEPDWFCADGRKRDDT